LLYEIDDGAQNPKDRELITMLNEKLLSEPEYPLPDGFVKVKEFRPVVSF
jgi:hypothetical protein